MPRKRTNKTALITAGGAAPALETIEAKAFAIAGPAEITIAAAEEGKPAKRPSVSIKAYDGGLMKPSGFYQNVVIDLASLRASPLVPILLDHDSTQIVGQARDVKIAASGVTINGSITGDDAPAQKVMGHSKNGFVWQASVGVQPGSLERVPDGQSVTVNGQSWDGPVLVARGGVLREVSLLSIGADDDSSASIAASAAGASSMNFEQWLKASGFDPNAITDVQRKVLQAGYDAEMKAAADKAKPEGDKKAKAPADDKAPEKIEAKASDPDATLPDRVREELKAERKRIAGIETICANGAHVAIKAKAIEEGWTPEQTELQVLRASRAPAGIVRGDSSPAVSAAAAECAMIQSFGNVTEKTITRSFKPEVIEAAGRMRGYSIGQLLHDTIRAAGLSVHPGKITQDTLRVATQADRMLRAEASFSSYSVPGILSNVMNKVLLDRFAQMNSVVDSIAYQTDTSDFKPFTRYRLDSVSGFTQVGPDGELKHITLNESQFSNQLQTTGGMITLTRQHMINDDMGAFMQIPNIFAEMALHAREYAVISAILGNASSFFGTGNNNYISGASTTIGVTGFDTATKAFREQKTKGNKFMLLNPALVLVPPALEGEALRMYRSQNTSVLSSTQKPQTNVYEGRFQPIVSPYLGTASPISGGDDGAWYLLAAPTSGAAIVQVGYLNGQRMPIFESGLAEFDTLGMQWRGYYDFGAALFEFRAGVKSKGGA